MATLTNTRAGFDDELALVGYEAIGELVEIGTTVMIVNPGNGGMWMGTVVDMDATLLCMYVRVDMDSFLPDVADFEETGPEAQRESFSVDEASEAADLDLFENTASGRLYTLRELDRLIQARRNIEEMFPFEEI